MLNKKTVLDYMNRESDKDNIFSGSYGRIANGLNVKHASSIRNMVIQLIDDGSVVVIEPPRRGMNHAKYQIVDSNNTDNYEDFEEIIVEFKGVKIIMTPSDIGYVISKKQLAMAIDGYIELIDTKVKNNAEQFKTCMTIIGDEQYFNKIGVMLFLNKLDLSCLREEKKQQLNEFQMLIAHKMCDVIVKGKATLTEENKIQLQSNICNLCEINQEQVEDLLSDIENQVNILFGKTNRENDSLKKEVKNITNLYEQQVEATHFYQSQAREAKLGN